MAYLTVTTQADVVDPGDGQLSLREAVAQANASSGIDTIRFSAAIVGQTLVLTAGELTITNDLNIDGNNDGKAARTTIDANQASRVLGITGGGTEVTVGGLVITDGSSEGQRGGGILLSSGAGLTLKDCAVTLNRTNFLDSYGGASGGGIFADEGTALLLDRTVVSGNNSAVPYLDSYSGRVAGGGIAAVNAKSVAIRNSTISHNRSGFGGGAFLVGVANATIENTNITNNDGSSVHSGGGGGLYLEESHVIINRGSISNNSSGLTGGGIQSNGGKITLTNSTIAANGALYGHAGPYGHGGGIWSSGSLVVRNSVITGNHAGELGLGWASGGGILARSLDISNSIVAGNVVGGQGAYSSGPDISTTIMLSNGHNVFGSDVQGSIPGDRKSITPGTLFAAVDPNTGGGLLSPTGIVPLRKNLLSNPALSAADPMTSSALGQLGTSPRPQPTGSLSDLGPAEAAQKLSTSPTVNNDVLTGSAAANNLAGLAGNDLIQGLGGADRLNGNDGSDVLDGGPGNDVLDGGTGLDIATFAGKTAVVVDLSTKPATAKRGSEKDRLVSIEGIIGSDKADTFKGDAADNEFQGGLGKDTATGGAGRDLYAFRAVQESPPGSGRDIIKGFAPGQDVIDLGNIDADATTPGRQSFRWVGKATLTGAAQLGYYVSGGNTIVRASTDGDAPAELEIQLTGVKTPTPGDFRF